MNKPYTFADRLNILLLQKNLTKTELAKLCGINKSNITRYLSGQYEAKQDVIYTMASKLNVNPAWLMGYDVPIDGNGELPPSDDDLSSYLEELRTRPEKRLLFDSTNGMSADQIEAIVQMIEKFK